MAAATYLGRCQRTGGKMALFKFLLSSLSFLAREALPQIPTPALSNHSPKSPFNLSWKTFQHFTASPIHQQALPGKDFCLHLSQTRAGVAIKAIVFIIHSDGWPSLPLPPSFIVISCFVIQRTRESRRVSKLLVVTRLPDEQTIQFLNPQIRQLPSSSDPAYCLSLVSSLNINNQLCATNLMLGMWKKIHQSIQKG